MKGGSVILSFIAEKAAKIFDPGCAGDEPVPIVMTCLMPQVTE
jgi:hypothetical protein